MKLQATALACIAAAAGLLIAAPAPAQTTSLSTVPAQALGAAVVTDNGARSHRSGRREVVIQGPVVVDQFGRTVSTDRFGNRVIVTTGPAFKNDRFHGGRRFHDRRFDHTGRVHHFDTLGDALTGRTFPAQHQIRRSQVRIEAQGRGLAHGDRRSIQSGHRGKHGGHHGGHQGVHRGRGHR